MRECLTVTEPTMRKYVTGYEAKEQLKDRRDYRQALQHRIAHSQKSPRLPELEARLAHVERQIGDLRAVAYA